MGDKVLLALSFADRAALEEISYDEWCGAASIRRDRTAPIYYPICHIFLSFISLLFGAESFIQSAISKEVYSDHEPIEGTSNKVILKLFSPDGSRIRKL